MSRANTNQLAFHERRRKFFVDPQVQGALLLHGIRHWLLASATFALILLIYRVVPLLLAGGSQQSSGLWYDFVPYLAATLALLPIAVSSAIRFSNRFAGPMVRIRRTLKQLSKGESTQMRSLREHDFWADTVDDINEIAALMCKLQTQPGAATKLDDNVVSREDENLEAASAT